MLHVKEKISLTEVVLSIKDYAKSFIDSKSKLKTIGGNDYYPICEIFEAENMFKITLNKMNFYELCEFFYLGITSQCEVGYYKLFIMCGEHLDNVILDGEDSNVNATLTYDYNSDGTIKKDTKYYLSFNY